MARSRNIKPGFFTNDVLGELPALTRLLFAGIWTICDREGRLEDRPKKIRAEVLPYDQCDADEMLQQLHDAGFIQRYQAGGKNVIQVLAWAEHQNPHMKEAASTLPAPDKHQTSTVLEQVEEQPIPEQAGLIPSSLIPDSLLPPSRSAKSSGSRLPEDWILPAELRTWAEAERPDLEIDSVACQFRDFWVGKAGKDGRKADWPATWRNWVRNQRQQAARAAAAPAWAGAR